MTAMQELEWEACLVEPWRDRELEREIRRELGGVPHALPYLTACPWVARSLVRINLNTSLVHTDSLLTELIWLAVSQDHSCRYCYAAHRAFLRILGHPEPQIRRLEQELFTAELDPHDRLALDFAHRVSRSNPLPSSADKRALREAGFRDDAIKELAFIASYVAGVNRIATLPAIPPEPVEHFPDRWFVRLARPFLARALRSRRRRAQPEWLSPELKTGPFSYLVLALDGLPAARGLRQLIDDAWASPLLRRRTKELIVAVVARGLGCERAEREATRLLVEHGLDESEVRQSLAHLASPELDPVETGILSLARETIRYQPAAIQRRARTVREKLDPAQFIELVGTVALANTICRLAVVVDEP